MSVLYKRVVLITKWKNVVLTGETYKTGCSFCHGMLPVTSPFNSDHLSFIKLTSPSRLLENGCDLAISKTVVSEEPFCLEQHTASTRYPDSEYSTRDFVPQQDIALFSTTEHSQDCSRLHCLMSIKGCDVMNRNVYSKIVNRNINLLYPHNSLLMCIVHLHERKLTSKPVSPKYFQSYDKYYSKSIIKNSCFKMPGVSMNSIFKTSHHIPGSSHCVESCLNVQNNQSGVYLIPKRHFTKSVNIKEEDVVTPQSIQKFLAASYMKFEQGYTCFISRCPKLSKIKSQEKCNEKLYINMTTGHFLCEHCQKLGGWPELKDNVLLLSRYKKNRKDYDCFKDVDSVQKLDSESRHVGDLWTKANSVGDLSNEDFNKLVEDFDCEKLNISTMSKYSVRYDVNSQSLLFPIYNMQSTVVGLKRLLLKLSDDESIKTTTDLLPRSGPVGLFGWNTVASDTKGVVMTSSVLDAMAVQQEIKVHAIALPKGFSVLPQELLPCLEQFKKIMLWFGDDIRAWEAAKQFAKKLGNKRCYVIRPSSDDPSPYKALCQGQKLRNILDKAKPIGHKSIVSFSQLRQEIFSELAHVEQVAGVKWKRFPVLNRILKGHRRGELTVFTGPTGSGKTTFISDYSLDLCMQGVNTLWGSFEINNVRLGKMMLTQFARSDLSKHLGEFDKWANLFEELPMYFMTFHGQENIKNVVETMSHAVYVHDIVHVVVDNLQFMMGTDEWQDKFTKQDMIISAFRKFATKMNCHVTLVIHPRKEKEADDLTIASIFGSAKATQEADNVLILQDKRLQSLRGNKYLQIAKNRFDGELGIMILKFDKEAKGFSCKDRLSRKEGGGQLLEEKKEGRKHSDDSFNY